MNNDLSVILASVTEEILEQVAFIFTDDTEISDKPDISTWKAIGAKVSFNGANSGTIHLWISLNMAKNIAANMLAIDSLDDINKIGDAVKEICNIITGNFITSAYANNVIALGIPERLPDELLYEDSESHSATWFCSEDEHILILVR